MSCPYAFAAAAVTATCCCAVDGLGGLGVHMFFFVHCLTTDITRQRLCPSTATTNYTTMASWPASASACYSCEVAPCLAFPSTFTGRDYTAGFAGGLFRWKRAQTLESSGRITTQALARSGWRELVFGGWWGGSCWSAVVRDVRFVTRRESWGTCAFLFVNGWTCATSNT